MTYSWYVGLLQTRTIRAADWTALGVTGSPSDTVWSAANGYSVDETTLQASQVNYLGTQSDFLTHQTTTPRSGYQQTQSGLLVPTSVQNTSYYKVAGEDTVNDVLKVQTYPGVQWTLYSAGTLAAASSSGTGGGSYSSPLIDMSVWKKYSLFVEAYSANVLVHVNYAPDGTLNNLTGAANPPGAPADLTGGGYLNRVAQDIVCPAIQVVITNVDTGAKATNCNFWVVTSR